MIHTIMTRERFDKLEPGATVELRACWFWLVRLVLRRPRIFSGMSGGRCKRFWIVTVKKTHCYELLLGEMIHPAVQLNLFSHQDTKNDWVCFR